MEDNVVEVIWFDLTSELCEDRWIGGHVRFWLLPV